MKIPPRLCVLCLALALPLFAPAQTAPLPPAAQDAMRKGNLAAQAKQWAVALRHFGEAQAAAPEAPEPLFSLGLAEAQLPGRELRSIAWFRAYLVLAPDAPNAAAVRDRIDTLDITAEGRANSMLALLKQLPAQIPAGGNQGADARAALAVLSARLAAPAPAPVALPADVSFTAAQRAGAWADFVRRELAAPLFTDLEPTLAGAAAVSATADNRAWTVFSATRSLADTYLARLAEIRRARPETDLAAGLLAERARKAEEAAAAVRAEQARQKAAERLAGFAEELKAVSAFVANLATDCGLTLVPITPGEFTMGSAGGDSDEKPQMRVTISRPFFLGATEVTQAQWAAVMGSSPSHFKGDTLPVEQVSWDDAMAFCKKLTERERAAGRLPAGWEFTLPTEAQWEYACRAGTTGDYAGDLDAMAWYGKNSESKTHAVGTKQPNAWGLHDMHGNVWEWCADWKDTYPGGSVTDPNGPPSGSHRVLRGGGWDFGAGCCRSANRSGDSPDFRGNCLGFRPALSSVR